MRGLWQGFPLSYYPFFMVAKGLSRWLLDVRARQMVQGVQVDRHLSLTHLLFVDGIFLFYYGSERDI